MVKNEKEGLYGEAESTKAQSIRFVIATTVVAIVVLGIAAWGIVYAISGNHGVKTEDTKVAETSKTEEKTEEKTTVEAADGENTNNNVIEVTSLKETTAETAKTTPEAATDTSTQATATNIPKTGPEDILPVAVLLGAAVAFFGSARLARSKN